MDAATEPALHTLHRAQRLNRSTAQDKKMYSLYSTVLLLTLANFGIASSSSTTCQIDDSTCLKDVMNSLYSEVATESCNPLTVPSMTRELPLYSYVKTNSNFTGLQGCRIRDVTVSSDLYMMRTILSCPSYGVAGDVNLSGYLLYAYVYGEGTYGFSCGPVSVYIYSKLDQVNGTEGTYFQIGNFSLFVKQEGTCSFTVAELYGGNATLTETAAEFATTNSLEVMSYVNLEYFFTPAFTIIFEKLNKKLVNYVELFTL